MPRKTTIPQPRAQRILKQMGENIRLSRLRRKFSASLVASRAGMSRATLHSLEAGQASVTVGSLINVLYTLGLERDLLGVARDDELGRKLQDAGLTVGKRAPKKT